MINKIAIMGCGSMGTILGAYLTKAGLDVTMVDVYKAHVDALNAKGATVEGGVNFTVPVKACTPEEMQGTYDLFVYFTKQTFNDTAIPQMQAHCDENTIICTCQNGLPELVLAKFWPEDKIMGCTVGWSATFKEPGASTLTCKPEDANFEMHVGRLTGVVDDKLEEVKNIFANMCGDNVHAMSDLIANRWAKVMINSTFSGMSTVAADTFGFALMDEKGGPCCMKIAQECVNVCNAMGMKMPVIFGIDFDAKTKGDLAELLAYCRKILGMNNGKASMLQDLELGRKCEIKYINGVVSEAGAKHGVATPFCDAVVDIVSRVENGDLPLANHIDMMPDVAL